VSLNVEAITELITELRSGKYIQGRAALRRSDHYCCLGIACEVAVRHGVIESPVAGDTSFDDGKYYYGPFRDAAYLPEVVRDWFGFDDKAPRYGDFVFAWANDDGVPFEKIADQFQLMLEADQASSLPVAHSHKDG